MPHRGRAPTATPSPPAILCAALREAGPGRAGQAPPAEPPQAERRQPLGGLTGGGGARAAPAVARRQRGRRPRRSAVPEPRAAPEAPAAHGRCPAGPWPSREVRVAGGLHPVRPGLRNTSESNFLKDL